VKSPLRASKASGSDRAKLELLRRRGWHPSLGLPFNAVLRKRRTRRGAGEGA
jgi:hypothetical protein